jgi:hypothetical protein
MVARNIYCRFRLLICVRKGMGDIFSREYDNVRMGLNFIH